MTRFLVLVEKTATGFSAYSPDVAECVATGATAKKAEQLFAEALAFHLEGLQLEGLPLPKPISSTAFVELAL